MHSPRPLPVSEILKVMPTDKSIAAIYQKIFEREKRTSSIPTWGRCCGMGRATQVV